MSEMKYAPAPWKWDSQVWDYDPKEYAPWLIDADENIVLSGTIECKDEAHALLLAAAPELLEALQKANFRLQFANKHVDCTEEIDLCNAAIDKATKGAE